jgi:hypothetical protein
MSKATNMIFALMTAFIIGISVMTLTWIHNLEEIMCKCSQDYKRDYIKYFLYVYIFFLVFIIGERFVADDLSKSAKYTVGIVKSLMVVALIINTIFAIIYINDLKGCKCSDDIRKDIYYYLNIIFISYVCLAIFIGILSVMFGFKIPRY